MARTHRVSNETLISLYHEHRSVSVVTAKSGYFDHNWVARRLRACGVELNQPGRQAQPKEPLPQKTDADDTTKLRLLARGCAKHPEYRARRQPTRQCAACRAMWEARDVLFKVEARA